MEAFNVLVTLGVALMGTQEWSLPVLILNFLTQTYSPPLTVTLVLLSRQPDFHLRKADIDAFIESLFNEDDCAWFCERYRTGKRKGISRSSVQVTLEHRISRRNDPFKNATLQNLCRKLVGKHTLKTHEFRVVPEWEMPRMTEDDRYFGSCLILGQLKDFEDNFSATTTQQGEETSGWVEHTMWLLERFFQQFGDFAAFLTEEDIVAICSLAEPGHKLEKLLALLSQFAKACRKKSKEEIHQCREELQKTDTRDLVQLVHISMKPLVKYGNDLKRIIEDLDTEGSHAYLSSALYRVIASNIYFCGAVGALSDNIESSRDRLQNVGTGGFLFGYLSAFLHPFATVMLASGIPLAFEWYLHKSSKSVDLLGSTSKMYTLLVMVKAGSFFTSDSAQYNDYRRLLWDNFKINVEAQGVQVNTFLENNGNEIHLKITHIRRMVLNHAKHYGLEPKLGDEQW